jgi:hypothetical protein
LIGRPLADQGTGPDVVNSDPVYKSFECRPPPLMSQAAISTERPMLRRYLVGCLAAASLASTPASQAAMRLTAPATNVDVQHAGALCGFGSHLDATGLCVDTMDCSRRCPPGSFAISFPNGNGFRCLPGEWQSAPGWFNDLLGLRD